MKGKPDLNPQGISSAGASAIAYSDTTIKGSGLRGYGGDQPTIGGFGYEPHPTNRKHGKKSTGPDCPECEGILSETVRPGRDENGTYLRWRECQDCGFRFLTAEQVVYAKPDQSRPIVRTATFNEVDVEWHETKAREARLRRGYQDPARDRGSERKTFTVYGSPYIAIGAEAARAAQAAGQADSE